MRITTINEWKKINEQFDNISFDFDNVGRDDWNKDLIEHGNRFHSHIDFMTPDEYLNRVLYKRFQIDPDKIKKYAQEFATNKVNIPVPTMWFMNKYQYDNGNSPSWHDGSHRVQALKEIGMTKIPVKIIYDTDRDTGLD